MISKQEVKHIAKLARLGLTSEEIEKLQKELSSILDYIEKLKEVDVSKVKPTSLSLDIENVMRGDIEKSKTELPFMEAKVKKRTSSSSPFKIPARLRLRANSLAGGQNSKLLDLAPETKNGYLKVKSILK